MDKKEIELDHSIVRNFILLALLAILLTLLFSCSPCNRLADKCPDYVQVDTITYLDSIVKHDTIISYEQDYYTFDALLDCDSSYNVVLKELYEEKGKEKIKTVVRFKDNLLSFQANVDSIITLNSLVEYYKNKKYYIVNPIDRGLQEQVSKLQKKVTRKNTYIYILLGIFLALMAVSYMFIRNKTRL